MNDLRFLALSNAQIKRIKSLHRKEGRVEEGMFLVEGLKPVAELIASGWAIGQLLVTERMWLMFQEYALPVLDKVQIIPDAQMERISSHITAPGVLAVADVLFQPLVIPEGPVLIVDDIQDPGNLGTMIRTAEWFGFSQVFVTPGCVEMFNPKVVASSMGSLFRLKPQVMDSTSIVRELVDRQGYQLVVSTLDGNTAKLNWPTKTALVIGSESHGVSPFWIEKAHLLVKIPSYGQAESLNAAIAFGILAAQFRSLA